MGYYNWTLDDTSIYGVVFLVSRIGEKKVKYYYYRQKERNIFPQGHIDQIAGLMVERVAG